MDRSDILLVKGSSVLCLLGLGQMGWPADLITKADGLDMVAVASVVNHFSLTAKHILLLKI